MKNSILLFLAFFLTSTVFAQTDPVEFNNAIVLEQSKVSAKNLEYISYSVHSKDFNEIERKRKEVIDQIEGSIKNVQSITPPEKGAKMKEEALIVLEMYKTIFNMDFVEVNELKKDSESSFDAMEKYFKAQDRAEKQLDRAADRFTKAQERFAKRSGFEIQKSEGDDPISAQIRKMNQVNEYTRKIYLIYFKADKAHSIFMDAMSKQDRSMDGKRRKMETAADEAIEQLKVLDGFESDTDYRDKALDIVYFYKEMASGGFVDAVKVNKMKQSELTQKDVDAFNNAIQKYNENINPLIMKFNEANQKLLKKHVPNLGVPKGKVSRT